MQTTKIYLENTYLFSDEGKIIHTGEDDKGYFLVLNKTIFYPQGGGQPSDQGYLMINDHCINIHHVKTIDDQIRHYSEQDCNTFLGKMAKLTIDKEKRLLHAKLHTSGHLISSIVEKLYPNYKAIKGHHFPGECYVEFSTQDSISEELNLETLNHEINKIIEHDLSLEKTHISGDELPQYCPNLPYSIPQKEKMILLKIPSFAYQPCGGTHINSTLELKGLSLTKQKHKGGNLKINYDIFILKSE